MTLVFTVTVSKCSQWNKNLALTQDTMSFVWQLPNVVRVPGQWAVSLFPIKGRRSKNSSFYPHNGCLMVLSMTNAALVCVWDRNTLVLGIRDVRDWNKWNRFKCKLYPDVFHFWRVIGWLTGLVDMRSIKSAWHDSRLSCFPMSSKPNLFKLFWGGVYSNRLGHWIWNN